MSSEAVHHLEPDELGPDESIDLRGTPCPLNFVKTKLKLQQMLPGTLLEVWLDPGEPIEQVPDSLSMEGYVIERLEDHGDYFTLTLRCPDNMPN